MISDANPPKVFISYSHDSPEHVARVLKLSDALCNWGIDCHIDQYELAPANWLSWMEHHIKNSEFVLIVCTEKYCNRFEGRETRPSGVGWEGGVISTQLYQRQKYETAKFIPIVFSQEEDEHIPELLRATHRHYINIEKLDPKNPTSDLTTERLYRHLAKMPIVVKPRVGRMVTLPPINVQEEFVIQEDIVKEDAQMIQQPLVKMRLSNEELKEAGEEPIRIFISYAQKDEKRFRLTLDIHLKILQRQGVIQTWHDRIIKPGTEWKDVIDANLEQSQIILLLVSSDFLASDYCYEIEMKRAMERHERGEAVVIPIIIRDCVWNDTPFAKLQGLPKHGKAIDLWQKKDTAWRNIADGIEKVARELRKKEVSDD